MQDGLRLEADRLTSVVPSQAIESHLQSLPGIYLAANRETAVEYARRAAQIDGGEPVLVTAVIDTESCHPDEDDVLEFLRNWILDRQPNVSAGLWASDPSLRQRTLERFVADLVVIFKPSSFEGNAASSQFLDAIFSVISEQGMAESRSARTSGGARTPRVLDDLLDSPDGHAVYAHAMDALCRSMRGTVPYDSDEYHTVRSVLPIRFEGDSRIVAIGTEDSPSSIYLTDEIERFALLDPGYGILCAPDARSAEMNR